MTIEGPGYLTATCDGCGETEEMEATEYGGMPASWGVDSATLEASGWVEGGGNEVFCPECAEERKEDGD